MPSRDQYKSEIKEKLKNRPLEIETTSEMDAYQTISKEIPVGANWREYVKNSKEKNEKEIIAARQKDEASFGEIKKEALEYWINLRNDALKMQQKNAVESFDKTINYVNSLTYRLVDPEFDAKYLGHDEGLVTVHEKIKEIEQSVIKTNALAEKNKQYDTYAAIQASREETIDEAKKMYADAQNAFNKRSGWQKFWARVLPGSMYKPAEELKKVEAYKAAFEEEQVEVDPEKFVEPGKENYKNDLKAEITKRMAELLTPEQKEVLNSLGDVDPFKSDWRDKLNQHIKEAENAALTLLDEENEKLFNLQNEEFKKLYEQEKKNFNDYKKSLNSKNLSKEDKIELANRENNLKTLKDTADFDVSAYRQPGSDLRSFTIGYKPYRYKLISWEVNERGSHNAELREKGYAKEFFAARDRINTIESLKSAIPAAQAQLRSNKDFQTFLQESYKEAKEAYDKRSGWDKFWGKRLPAGLSNSAADYDKMKAYEEILRENHVDLPEVEPELSKSDADLLKQVNEIDANLSVEEQKEPVFNKTNDKIFKDEIPAGPVNMNEETKVQQINEVIEK